MTDLVKSGVCVRCGGALAAGEDAQGTCPKCLLQWAFAADPGETRPRQGSLAVPDWQEGDLTGRFGPYTIEGLLGRGGMGVVYRARQASLNRVVAVKVLPEVFARDEAFTERFQREARAMATLSHPNIVSVHDFGCMEGRFYFAMEYVDGGSLRDLLRAGPLSPARVLTLVSPLCDALQYAHDRGVVHRDIKPENILVDREGRARVADFGLAKIAGGSDPAYRSLTRSDHVVGTLHYMAPEQIERPKQVDHRADLYALGVVCYEMLTGELPLGRFDPPSRKSSVNPALDDVVFRALEKDPGRRYSCAADLKADLLAKADAPVRSRQPVPKDGRVVRRSRGLALAAVGASVLVALMCGGVGSYLMVRRSALREQQAAMAQAQEQARRAAHERGLPFAVTAAEVEDPIRIEPVDLGIEDEVSEAQRAAIQERLNAAREAMSGLERRLRESPADAEARGLFERAIQTYQRAEQDLARAEGRPATPIPESGAAVTAERLDPSAAEPAQTRSAPDLAALRVRHRALYGRLFRNANDLRGFVLGPTLYEQAVREYDQAERELAAAEQRAAEPWRDPRAGLTPEQVQRYEEAASWVDRLSARHTVEERREAARRLVGLYPEARSRLEGTVRAGLDGNGAVGAVLADYRTIDRLRKDGANSVPFWRVAWDQLHQDPDAFERIFRAAHSGADAPVTEIRRRVEEAHQVLARFMTSWSEMTGSESERERMTALENEVRNAGLSIVPGLVMVLEEDMVAAFSRVTDAPFESVWTRKVTARDQVKAIHGLAGLKRPETAPVLARHLSSMSLTAASNAVWALQAVTGERFARPDESGLASPDLLTRARAWWDANRGRWETPEGGR